MIHLTRTLKPIASLLNPSKQMIQNGARKYCNLSKEKNEKTYSNSSVFLAYGGAVALCILGGSLFYKRQQESLRLQKFDSDYRMLKANDSLTTKIGRLDLQVSKLKTDIASHKEFLCQEITSRKELKEKMDYLTPSICNINKNFQQKNINKKLRKINSHLNHENILLKEEIVQLKDEVWKLKNASIFQSVY